MTREPTSGEALIAAANPEILLPIAPREQYPDLPLLFGAYFGQDDAMDDDALDGDRWRAERRFNIRITPMLRDRVADQLRQLLTEPDDEFRVCVEALGSHVLPEQLRRWVTGLLRRITVPDWTLPPDFVDQVTH